MSFIARWLGLSVPRPRAGRRPHREFDVAASYDAAYDRVLDAIERTIGANVVFDDRRSGTIEAAFGLVNAERVVCTLAPVDGAHTTLRIEASFPAGAVPAHSLAVDALADALE